MNFPKVQCAICKEEVSKRSTVLLEPVIGKPGRGCRNHPEVSEVLEGRKVEVMLRRSAESTAAEEELRMATLCLRTLNIVFEIPTDQAVAFLRMTGAPETVLSEAEKRLKAMDPEPSPEEEMDLAIAAIALVSAM